MRAGRTTLSEERNRTAVLARVTGVVHLPLPGTTMRPEPLRSDPGRALAGYGLNGAPRGGSAELIRRANRQNALVFFLGTRSGIDTTTGWVFNPAIAATATLTLVLPKTGFEAPRAKALIGELYLADIAAFRLHSIPDAGPGLGY